MSKFVLKNIEAIKGKQQFKQLVILPDNDNAEIRQADIIKKEQNNIEISILGELDIYENSLEVSYKKSIKRIFSIMDSVANLVHVSGTKFHEITPANDPVKEFEFKADDLRVYAIKITSGKLIILGGYKNQQKKDIIKFRALKKQYLQFLNNQ